MPCQTPNQPTPSPPPCSNKKPEQKSSCEEGKPVNPILGCKILTEEADVVIDGYIPLVWRRTYASDVEI